jgi:hypothetical protein
MLYFYVYHMKISILLLFFIYLPMFNLLVHLKYLNYLKIAIIFIRSAYSILIIIIYIISV